MKERKKKERKQGEESLMSSSLAPSMAHEEDKHSLEAQFDAAVKVIWSLPEEGPYQPSDDMMLMFYSYYKQATLGPCNIPRPTGFWDSRGKAKWDAWSALGEMTKEEAMKKYVEDIQLILETIPISEEVSDLVQSLGNFYMEVEGDGEDGGENGVDMKPFTRPFERHRGYGDLWDDIQNPQEMGGACSLSTSSEQANESMESSEWDREGDRSYWKQREEEEEEEERGDGSNAGSDEDEEEEEEKDYRPDPRLLAVEDRRWRADTRESSSSVEPSVSSVTNGTHSSLNSEMEEDELACSIEPSVQSNMYMHFNGHLSALREDIPEKTCRSTDSDNEEFCDSMEHLAMEEATSKNQSPGPRSASVRQTDLWFESNATLNGGEDHILVEDSYFKDRISAAHHGSLSRRGRGSQSPKSACTSQLCVHVDAACCCVAQTSRLSTASRGNVNEQIAAALLRLQQDMADVLHRLHALEELSVSQSRSPSPQPEHPLRIARKFVRPSWWPFDHSPFTVVLTAFWPLIAFWLVQLYSQRKRRKIT